MPVDFKEDLVIFLNKRYAALNPAYPFERARPTVSFHADGNRPKAVYQFSTGQFTEEFGVWFENYLVSVFGKDSVVCDSNVINPMHPQERIFCFSIYGDPEELAKKSAWWETQGIEKSENNLDQLIGLIRKHEEALFDGYKVVDVFISGLFNRVVVIDFQPAFEDNKIAYEVFKKAQRALSLNRAFVMGRNEDEKIHQFYIELEKVSAIDVLRSASRNGFRLEA